MDIFTSAQIRLPYDEPCQSTTTAIPRVQPPSHRPALFELFKIVYKDRIIIINGLYLIHRLISYLEAQIAQHRAALGIGSLLDLSQNHPFEFDPAYLDSELSETGRRPQKLKTYLCANFAYLFLDLLETFPSSRHPLVHKHAGTITTFASGFRTLVDRCTPLNILPDGIFDQRSHPHPEIVALNKSGQVIYFGNYEVEEVARWDEDWVGQGQDLRKDLKRFGILLRCAWNDLLGLLEKQHLYLLTDDEKEAEGDLELQPYWDGYQSSTNTRETHRYLHHMFALVVNRALRPLNQRVQETIDFLADDEQHIESWLPV